jgi:protein-tyrosine phosphatase
MIHRMAPPSRPPYEITKYLAIGPCRGAGGPSVTDLASAGFKHIIDLNADNSEKSLSKVAGLSYHPIKTIDEYSLEVWMKNLQETVNVIDRAEQSGEKVYLHCTYGRGRSATMAMAYLLSKNWSVPEATKYVKARGSLIWCEGNPVSKYESILRSYSGRVVGRSQKKRAGARRHVKRNPND